MPERGSEWVVIQRCLALLRRLASGDATTAELTGIIQQYDPDPLSADQLSDRLEKDLRRLRDLLGCDIQFQRSERSYRLIQLGFPLLELPDAALRGLAFLQQTFSRADILHGDEVQRLVDQVLRGLPETQQTTVGRMRGLLELELRSRDSKAPDADVIEKLSLACSAHREIEFDYISPHYQDGQPRRVRAEPIRYYLDSQRRHYLVEVWRLAVTPPDGDGLVERTYRLERIHNLTVLPHHFTPRRRPPRVVELVYRLAPEIARLRDLNQPPDSEIVYLPDGSAEIHRASANLFMDLRELLRYGPNCEVIGGADARREMALLVAGLAAVYGIKSAG